MHSISLKLGAHIAQITPDSIPTSVMRHANLCLLHDLLMGVAAIPHEQVIQPMATRIWRAPREARLISNGQGVSAEGAAFANAALMNLRSQDDTHEGSVSHPGVPTIAAALALADQAGSSGPDVLAAIVAGYETVAMVGRPAALALNKRAFRAAPVFGVFGATAAASRILGLDAERTVHALGLATQFAAGTGQVWVEGSPEFTAQMGNAARNGVLAARLAQAGLEAAPQAFEGRSGFYAGFAGLAVTSADIFPTGAARWATPEVTVKYHPACAVLQGPITLLQQIRTDTPVAKDWAKLNLHLSPFEAGYAGIDNAGPITSPTAAKMSAQFCLALTLRDGMVAFEKLQNPHDPAIAARLEDITVISDDNLKPRQSSLRLTYTDGTASEASMVAPEGQSDLHRILQNASESLAGPMVAQGLPQRLSEACLALPDGGSFGAVWDALTLAHSHAPAPEEMV